MVSLFLYPSTAVAQVGWSINLTPLSPEVTASNLHSRMDIGFVVRLLTIREQPVGPPAAGFSVG